MRAKTSRFGILVTLNGVAVIAGAAILKIFLWYLTGISFLLIGIANLTGIRFISDRNGDTLKYRKYGNLIFWSVMTVMAALIWVAAKARVL